jgi:hypothetical protein
VTAAKKYHGLTDADCKNRLYVWAREKGIDEEFEFNIATHLRPGVIKPNDELIASFTKRIIENEIDVVYIDPLREAHSVPENDNAGMGKVIKLFANIAARTDCAIGLWHHTRKGNGGEMSLDSARGASAITDVPRSVEIGEKMTVEHARQMGIDRGRCGFYFSTWGVTNFAPPIDQRQWFELKNVDLDNAFPGDSVGVVTTWQPPAVTERTLSPGEVEQIKARVGTEPLWREDVRASMWVGRAVAEVLGLDHEDDRELVKGAAQAADQDGGHRGRSGEGQGPKGSGVRGGLLQFMNWSRATGALEQL